MLSEITVSALRFATFSLLVGAMMIILRKDIEGGARDVRSQLQDDKWDYIFIIKR